MLVEPFLDIAVNENSKDFLLQFSSSLTGTTINGERNKEKKGRQMRRI